jgi:hypothetical protein
MDIRPQSRSRTTEVYLNGICLLRSIYHLRFHKASFLSCIFGTRWLNRITIVGALEGVYMTARQGRKRHPIKTLRQNVIT